MMISRVAWPPGAVARHAPPVPKLRPGQAEALRFLEESGWADFGQITGETYAAIASTLLGAKACVPSRGQADRK